MPEHYQSDDEPDDDSDGAVPDQVVVDEARVARREEVAFAEQLTRGTDQGFVGVDWAGARCPCACSWST